MKLDEAKKVLEDQGYLLESADYSVNMDKLNRKIKEMQIDANILERVGTMVAAFFDREYDGMQCKCVIDEYDEEHSWYVKIMTDADLRSAMIFEISISDYNDKTLWIEYDIFGKEGGIEAKYSNDKYYSLLNDENSYLGKIMDLVKGEE
jgi:hypothetical protein